MIMTFESGFFVGMILMYVVIFGLLILFHIIDKNSLDNKE